MKKPILVVMAAGMGSRYGGLKQMGSGWQSWRSNYGLFPV